jgi:hypothetical protein
MSTLNCGITGYDAVYDVCSDVAEGRAACVLRVTEFGSWMLK